MWNSLKWKIQDYFCDNNHHCVLEDVLNVNEELHKELSVLHDKQENSVYGCKLISAKKQAVLIDVSDNKSNYICIRPTYSGNIITDVDFYGYFGVTQLMPLGNKQTVHTNVDFDSNGILRCHIIDFLCSGNCGYGSIMMNILKQYLQGIPVAYIDGWISPVDSKDSEDPSHNERLHHFYRKHGFKFYQSENSERIKLDMHDYKKYSKEYLEHTQSQLEISGYENNLSRLLFERKITMNDLDRSIRINKPNFYLVGLKAAAGNAKTLLQTLTLLCNDIDSVNNEKDCTNREKLIDRLYAYIDPLRYQQDNEELIEFVQTAMKKYPPII